MSYIFNTYGEDKVASIGKFGTNQTKGAIHDMCKAFGYDLELENTIAKSFEDYSIADIDQMISGEIPTSNNAKQAIEYVIQYPELFDYVRKLDGLPKSFGLHACGKVISTRPLDEFLPSCYDSEGIRYLQGDMHDVEDVGLVKIDVLGLRTLDQLYDTLEQSGESKEFIDPRQDFKDDKVLDVFRRGDTVGIFQMSSYGMKQTLKKMNVSGIDDLSIANALYRPGAMAYIDDFCSRRTGKQEFEYLHPDLEPILRGTYGIIVFQEQLIEIGRMAGIKNPDLLRKATGKKDIKLLNKIKPELHDKLAARGWSEEQFDKLWSDMLAFASYSFNKCLWERERVVVQVVPKGMAADENIICDSKISVEVRQLFDMFWEDYDENDFYLLSMNPERKLYWNKVEEILYAGLRGLYEVTASDGASVKCTSNHKIPTVNGLKKAEEITYEDIVFAKAGCIARPIKVAHAGMLKGFGNVYDITMAAPDHNFVTESGLVVCNSHASAYAIIAYNTAKQKAYYPVEFFAGLCNSYIGKSNFVKDEAAEIIADLYAHKIRIQRFDFRQDHRRCHNENGYLVYAIPLIASCNEQVGDVIYQLGKNPPEHFWECLRFMYDNGVNKAQVDILIKLSFFDFYCNQRECTRIKDVFELFKCGEATKIAKSKLEQAPELEAIVRKYANDKGKNGSELKSYTVTDMAGLLDACELYVLEAGISDMDTKNKLANQMKYLGFAPIATGQEEDKRKMLVTKMYKACRKKDGAQFGWNVSGVSIGSGKAATFTVFNRDYKEDIAEGDILLALKYTPSYNNGVKYWNLNEYRRLC